VSFIEVLADGWNTANLLWDMGWDPATREWTQGLGAREYLFFHAQDYDAGVNPIPGDDNILANAGSADVAWAMWPAPVEGSAYLQSAIHLRNTLRRASCTGWRVRRCLRICHRRTDS
jgi:hypothetical protein